MYCYLITHKILLSIIIDLLIPINCKCVIGTNTGLNIFYSLLVYTINIFLRMFWFSSWTRNLVISMHILFIFFLLVFPTSSMGHVKTIRWAPNISRGCVVWPKSLIDCEIFEMFIKASRTDGRTDWWTDGLCLL